MTEAPAVLQQFYINEDQSLYLMSHQDAQKIRDWVNLCKAQLSQLGFHDIEMIGKGAYGFVFGGTDVNGLDFVFKFSRINLPQRIQDRLEEEAWMQSQVQHPNIPAVREYTRLGRQSVLMMERARGMDLERYAIRHGRLSPRLVVKIAAQLVDILRALRRHQRDGEDMPIVHGDIKPSNIVFDPDTETIRLVDWGSSVFAQLDANGQPVGPGQLGLFSGDSQSTNAKLGDVYFIGEDQLNGGLSSPRFDEQGAGATLYAIASALPCRYGYDAIPATALNLPREFARTLQTLLAGDFKDRQRAGDYLLTQMPRMARIVMPELPMAEEKPQIPIWTFDRHGDMETVVYSSRRSFLREEQIDPYMLARVDDVELEKYYKNFMHGMGPTERAFLAAVSRLGKFPIVGGLAVHWEEDGVYMDSSLNLHDPALRAPFVQAVNNMVTLGRAIHRQGIFKCCMFDARVTQHVERASPEQPFVPPPELRIPYDIHTAPTSEDSTRNHSYFEDGDDPDESLELPQAIMDEIIFLNDIRHTGLIIFESMPTHLKVHNYYVLLDPTREKAFSGALERIIQAIPEISGLGVSGFMKLPYKNTRRLSSLDQLPERFFPRDPRAQSRARVNVSGTQTSAQQTQ
ncbi:MAG: protein kinase [Natronospirillum sp.]|uniref:protein kinase domain-containing protein n=1 Tax=Natronospirillum sp. TaxID=2812955 RepID=UPI0025E67CF6|nr:protein kinase [Natronospirillum sp.]MCH8552001.1 protein kinase [Natronospirillum sp.]